MIKQERKSSEDSRVKLDNVSMWTSADLTCAGALANGVMVL